MFVYFEMVLVGFVEDRKSFYDESFVMRELVGGDKKILNSKVNWIVYWKVLSNLFGIGIEWMEWFW